MGAMRRTDRLHRAPEIPRTVRHQHNTPVFCRQSRMAFGGAQILCPGKRDAGCMAFFLGVLLA